MGSIIQILQMDIPLELKVFYKSFEKNRKELTCNSSLEDDELFSELVLSVNNNEKYNALHFVKEIYNKYKYCDYNTVVEKIKESGFAEELFKATDFINLAALEESALDIYKSGIPFPFYQLLPYVNAQMEINFLQRIQIKYSVGIEIIPYEKDRLVTQIQLDIENAHRRIKYSKGIKPLDEFAQSTLDLDKNFEKELQRISNNEAVTFCYSNLLKKSITNPQNTMQILGKVFFESIRIYCECIEKPITTKQIFFAFEPIFRIIFDSSKRGLYSREDFDKLNYHIYDGYYNKFYLARLKTLTGYR